jgi:hypothetical protein
LNLGHEKVFCHKQLGGQSFYRGMGLDAWLGRRPCFFIFDICQI